MKRRTDTIVQFVTDRWNMGMQPYAIWKLTQETFTHKCCAWTYVNGICRRLANEQAKQVREQGDHR